MNKFFKLTSGFIVLGLLSACASTSGNYQVNRPIVDTYRVDPYKFEQDLAQCQNLAQQINTGNNVVSGSIAGAVVGGLLGAAVGDHRLAGKMAGAGAVLGGASSAGGSEANKESVVKRCLSNRGYRILN